MAASSSASALRWTANKRSPAGGTGAEVESISDYLWRIDHHDSKKTKL